ncbi:MAG: hypothetical protein HYZ42_15215 [Bacteroidetes bacterium]|nr:hypothetical protein [Bacteroidota bacterium]
MNYKRLTIYFIITGALLLIASLTQNCYCLGNDCGDSIAAFLFGWLGIFVELGDIANFLMEKSQGREAIFNFKIGATICWLANPLIIISFITLKYAPKATIVISSLSTLLILSFLLFKYVISDEAGHYNEITAFKAGYFLWLASSLTILIGSIYLTPKLTDKIKKNTL